MDWWLEGAISKHFRWVRNLSEAIFCIFLESEKKSKKKNFPGKIGFYRKKSVFIGKIDDFSPIFFFPIFPLQNIFQAHRNLIFLRKIGQFRRFFCPCLYLYIPILVRFSCSLSNCPISRRSTEQRLFL